MHAAITAEPYAYRICLALALNMGSAYFVATVVSKSRAGWPRAYAALPVLLINSFLPALFRDNTEVISKATFLLCSMWISNFKLLALCLDRGSLIRPWTLAQFIAIYLVPITPRNEKPANGKAKAAGTAGDVGGKTSELALCFLAKLATLAGVSHILTSHGHGLSLFTIHLLYAISLYTLLGCIYDGPASLATSMIGLEIAPHFNKPFFAESFTSLWGRRWNMSVGNTLRVLIYDPIQEGQLVRAKHEPTHPTMLRRWIGACACFLVSGLMHEAIYWYAEDRHSKDWKWLTFFVIQALIIGIVGMGRKVFKKYHVAVPKWLAVCVTVPLQMWLAHIFFFPPCTDADMTGKVLGGLIRNFNAMRNFVKQT